MFLERDFSVDWTKKRLIPKSSREKFETSSSKVNPMKRKLNAEPIPPPSPSPPPPDPDIPPKHRDDEDYDDAVAAKTPKIIDLNRLRKLQKLLTAAQQREAANVDRRDSTPKGKFQQKIAEGAFKEEQAMLWGQLQKVSKEHRAVAEKMLVYLVMYQRDLIRFTTRGELILDGHVIPGSNVAVSLDSLLSTDKQLAIGELALLQALRHAPTGLWHLISAQKRRWVMHTKTKQITPEQVTGPPPAEAKNEIIQLTKNKKDGLLMKPDQNTRFDRVLHDQGIVPSIKEPKGHGKKRTVYDEAWYKIL